MELKKKIEKTKADLEFIRKLKGYYPDRTLTRIERDLEIKLKTLEELL